MSRRVRILRASALGLTAVLLAGHGAHGSDDWLKEAKAAWKAYVDRPLPAVWVARLTHRFRNSPETVFHMVGYTDGDRQLLFCLFPGAHLPTGDQARLANAEHHLRSAQDVVASNERYAFSVNRIGREKESEDEKNWRLLKLAAAGSDNLELVYAIRAFFWFPVSVANEAPLEEVFASGHVEIVSANEVKEGNRSLFRVVIEWAPPAGFQFERTRHGLAVGRYTLYFDPSHFWCVVREEAETTVEEKRIRRTIVRSFYEDSRWLKRQEVTRQADGQDAVTRIDELGEFFDTANVPEELYYLPAYGIAEPDELKAAPRARGWLFAVIGAAVAVSGMWVASRRRS